MNKYLRFITDPKFRFSILVSRGFYRNLPDEAFLKRKYWLSFHKELNLEDPKTFSEKLQWLKLYNRKPVHTTMVDKYAVKDYVVEQIGQSYIIPTLGVWDSFDDIDFDALPDQFVLKCTHDSGGLVICRDKSKLNMAATRKKLEKSLKRNYYYASREWPYKNVRPRILAETYMQDGDNLSLPVYKIFCFDGEPKLIQSIQNDKTPQESIDYFDSKWNRLELRQNFPNSETPLPKPENLEKMLELARRLSKGFAFLRTDFYVINGCVYFSEYTFFSDSGLAKFHPDHWDRKLGDWIKLPSL